MMVTEPSTPARPVNGCNAVQQPRKSLLPIESRWAHKVSFEKEGHVDQVTPIIGPDWDGRLEEWVAEVIAAQSHKQRREIWDLSFPTDALRDEYLESIAT